MKRLIILPLMTVLVLAFAAAACGAAGDESFNDSGASGILGFSDVPGRPGAPAASERKVVETVVVEKPVSRSARLPDPDVVERKIVTNVDMNVRVDDVNGAMELVTRPRRYQWRICRFRIPHRRRVRIIRFHVVPRPVEQSRSDSFTGARYFRAR